MQNLSQPFPKPAHASDTKEQENWVKSSSYNSWTTIQQTVTYEKEREKAVCIIGGESEALGFHQEAMEEPRKQQDWFCIKLYIILCTKTASFRSMQF